MPSSTKTGEIGLSAGLAQSPPKLPRILAADDQQHILEAIELLLKPQGYEVDVVRSREFFLRRGVDRSELHAGHHVRTGRSGATFRYCRDGQHAADHCYDCMGQR